MEHVKEFVQIIGDIPNVARPFTKHEVITVVNMIASELVELAQTVMNTDDAINTVQCAALIDTSEYERDGKTSAEILSDQSDAFIDMQYYALDRTLRCGINLDRYFHLVHNANMSKQNPDGSFNIRDDGKILKPDGWTAPNMLNESLEQMKHNFL